MVALGVGKNMVRSIRFWVEVAGIGVAVGRGAFELTSFAQEVLAPEDGLDPYLEDRRTLWLLHWRIATFADDPAFAWRYLINHWPHPEFTRTEVIEVFGRESERLGYRHSPVTLGEHFDVFLHTYVRTRRSASAEDALDGPLVELDLVEEIGDRKTGAAGRRETLFAFRRGPKPDISQALFAYCVNEYWNQWHPGEATLTYRDIALAECSVGQVFNLGEEDVRARLEAFGRAGAGPFRYQPSAVQGTLHRSGPVAELGLLREIYGRAAAPGAQGAVVQAGAR